MSDRTAVTSATKPSADRTTYVITGKTTYHHHHHDKQHTGIYRQGSAMAQQPFDTARKDTTPNRAPRRATKN